MAPGADAGATYEKLAAVHLKLDSKHEAASSYMEAAKCYQKTDKKGAPLRAPACALLNTANTASPFMYCMFEHIQAALQLQDDSRVPLKTQSIRRS